MQFNAYPIEHEGRTFLPYGEITRTPEPGTRLGCGHRAPRRKAGCIFPGYVIRHGRTMCKWCASRAEVRDFKRSDAFVGYLAGRSPQQVTTWLGAPLARITRHQVSRRIWLPTGGSYCRVTIRAEALDGSQWYGHGTDCDQIIRLRRNRTAPRRDR